MDTIIVGDRVFQFNQFPTMVYHPKDEPRTASNQKELNDLLSSGWYRSAQDCEKQSVLDYEIKELQSKLDKLIAKRIELYGELEPEDVEDVPAVPLEDHTPAPRGGKPGRPKKAE